MYTPSDADIDYRLDGIEWPMSGDAITKAKHKLQETNSQYDEYREPLSDERIIKGLHRISTILDEWKNLQDNTHAKRRAYVDDPYNKVLHSAYINAREQLQNFEDNI